MSGAAKKVFLTTLGWLLLVAGVAALVLPGPGLILLFAGLAVLSQQYTWAERWLEPVELRALRGAADSVETWPRVVMSTVFSLAVGACGVLWIVGPDAPGWWPLDDKWWLFGGIGTGITLLVSCLVALALLVYAFRRFHGKPEALEELGRRIEEADEDMQEGSERLKERMHRHD
ncbi:MAG TPA: PGPGW domain-containing protein [Nocardioides sp.]|nr:PGPGW domain-containing protein [Nocardioides sp.]